MKNLKKSLKQQMSILKGELYLNTPIWLVQTIITAAVMLMLFLFCFMFITRDNYIYGVYPFNSEANLFQFLFQMFLIGCSSVFSLIYMIKSLSYLFNKRKLDMYGSMPITRRVFLNGKVLSSFVMSVTVYIIFQIIAFVIGIATGATFENHEIAIAVSFIFYIFFIISFYSLCTVCSKSVWTAVISMFIIEIFLPLLANLFNNFLQAFFYGVNPYYIYDFKLLNIFSLPSDGDLIYIVYWVVLGALLLWLSNWFIKKRNPENRKSSFVFPALEYLIKILISLTAGVILGLIMGSLGKNNGLIAFIIGFLLASVPVYIVMHIIYNKGVSRLPKNLIALGILIVVGVGCFWLCDANPMQFKTCAPEASDIESAGLIDTGNTFIEITPKLITESAEDFSDEETIDKIVNLHKEIVDMSGNMTAAEKCQRVFTNILSDFADNALNNEYYNSRTNGCILTYKLKNGGESTYFYNADRDEEYYLYSIYIDSYNERNYYANYKIANALAEIEFTDTYMQKYRALYTLPEDKCDTFSVVPVNYEREDNEDTYTYDEESGEYYADIPYYDSYRYTSDYSGNNIEKKNFKENLETITEALKKDIANDKQRADHCKPYIGSVFTYGYCPEDIATSDYSAALAGGDVNLAVTFGYGYDEGYGMYCAYDVYYIPESYTNTINALIELNIIDSETHEFNEMNSKVYFTSAYTEQ